MSNANDWAPMLASPPKSERLPTLAGTHAFDIKLDGIRAIAHWDGAFLTLINRSGNDITNRFPDLTAAAAVLGDKPLILDGEIVACSGSFQDTAKRDKQNRPADVARWAAQIPVNFVGFDLLMEGGEDLRRRPWHERRKRLESLLSCFDQPDDRFVPSVVSYDPGFFEVVKSMGMEGVIAKRINAPYRAGRYSDWVKFKTVRSVTCVAFGYEPGTGARAHFGAMFLSMYDVTHGEFVGVGRVGTGMDTKEIGYLKAELDAGRPVICEIECLNVTRDGSLRFPVYKGARTDLSVLDAKIEQLADIPRT